MAILLGLCLVRNQRTASGLVALLVLTLFVDVATNTYVHVKSRWARCYSLDETPAEDGVGLKVVRTDIHTGYYTEFLISYRSLVELREAGLEPNGIPYLRVFAKVHPLESAAAERKIIEQLGGYEKYDSLGIKDADSADLADFLNSSKNLPLSQVTVNSVKRTYNTFAIELTSTEKCVLFIRDGYSPYWSVKINGAPVKLHRALVNFKALAIPQGTSKVLLKFTPPGIPWISFLSLLAFWGSAMAWCVQAFVANRRTAKPKALSTP
jgi:hypothetical protein